MNKVILVKDGNVDNPDISNIIIDTAYPNPKIYTKANPPHAGIISVNWQSAISISQGTTRILDYFPHNLGYIPTVFGTFKFDTGLVIREGTLPFQYGGIGMIFIDADLDNINLKYHSTDIGAVVIPSFIMQVRYYVMVEAGL